MEAEQFCYWLKGYVELDGSLPSEDKWNMIIQHLDLVFLKLTPKLGQRRLQMEDIIKELERRKNTGDMYPNRTIDSPKLDIIC